MFTFLERWRKKRRTLAMLRAGAIFAYWDGQKIRYADPFKIWRELTQDDKVNLERLLPDVDDADTKAVDVAVAHVCKVFDVQRWDDETQTGLTDLELLALLGQVIQWTNFVKKNSNRGPTSPPATASASSTGREPPSEITNACGACTSTETGRKPDEAGPCCGQSETPSGGM